MNQAEFEYLDRKLDQVLELLKTIVVYTADNNATIDYLEELINEVQSM